MARQSATRKRKNEHLEFCMKQDVEFQTRDAWLDCVGFVHQAVPDVALSDIDLSTRFLGKRLDAPFLIGAMTGGTPEAGRVNRQLAEVAAEFGIGLALGSQRAMIEDSVAEKSFQVRDVAPDILLLGNIGIAQAAAMKSADVRDLIDHINADGINLHLNTAMEIFQHEGDRAPDKPWAAIRRLSKSLGRKLIVKETGCGISRETAMRLVECGVKTIDVAGVGGTSWVRVENLRRGGAPEGLEFFEEWGIPTAASLVELRNVKVSTIASGGLRTGLDLARSIALGAEIGSAALPTLRALGSGGKKGLRRWLESLFFGLKTTMALTGCRKVADLRKTPIVLADPLRDYALQRKVWR
jgi:isopentenyl-diphosphate Delta-isomerase